MFFDLHSDILYDIVLKRLDHKKNIIKDRHLPELLKGNFSGGIWCYYTDIDYPLCDIERAVDYILEELESCRDIIQIVRTKDDFHDYKLNVVLGFESLQPVDTIETFEQFARVGFRHAMLTWNEANHYGTGVDGPDHRGLTSLGKELIRYMEDHHMIIDVSHANRQTFYDIVDTTNVPLLASHSNLNRLRHHRRNLTDDQVTKIVERGGLVGLTSVPNFTKKDSATIHDLIHHLNDYRDKNWLDHVGFGFDFMHYIDGTNIPDLETPLDTPNLLKALQSEGYSEDAVNKISSQNAIQFIKKILQ